jgi:hypothetical protein
VWRRKPVHQLRISSFRSAAANLIEWFDEREIPATITGPFFRLFDIERNDNPLDLPKSAPYVESSLDLRWNCYHCIEFHDLADEVRHAKKLLKLVGGPDLGEGHLQQRVRKVAGEDAPNEAIIAATISGMRKTVREYSGGDLACDSAEEAKICIQAENSRTTLQIDWRRSASVCRVTKT